MKKIWVDHPFGKEKSSSTPSLLGLFFLGDLRLRFLPWNSVPVWDIRQVAVAAGLLIPCTSTFQYVDELNAIEKSYPFSHNHGSVENYLNWKETNIGGTHFPLAWLWEERVQEKLVTSEKPCDPCICGILGWHEKNTCFFGFIQHERRIPFWTN